MTCACYRTSSPVTAWIWNLAARHFPKATQIMDLYHAREHLHDLARLLEFTRGDHMPPSARRAALSPRSAQGRVTRPASPTSFNTAAAPARLG